MLGSVDSVSVVSSYPTLRPEEVEEFGFNKKRSKFGSYSWFDNGMSEIHEPQFTFYQTWGKIFRLRIDFNAAKLFYGSNILLPSITDIQDVLVLVSNNVKQRTGLYFDAHSAKICRIHYAFNKMSDIDDVKHIIGYYANYKVPRTKRYVIDDETVYFRNKSRGIRIYDKNAEVCKKNPIPELIEKSEGITRFEYFIDGLKHINRFAKRMKFKSTSAEEMLSESNIMAATNELQALLNSNNLNLGNQDRIGLIFEKTKNLTKSAHLSGFLDAVQSFGKEFCLKQMGKSTFYRHLRECQKLGL